MESILADVAAFVADSVTAIECEIVGSVMCCNLEKLTVLILGKVFCNVHVQGGTAVEILDIVLAVHLELVNH